MADRWILLLDDLDEWRETLSRLLRRERYLVDTAESRVEALQRLDERMYHLVILDIRLAYLDESNIEGLTILDEIDGRYGKDAIEKIMISAYGTKEQMRKAFRNHDVSDFILKDAFTPDEFLNSVRQAFVERVKTNPALDIVLEDGLTFREMMIGLSCNGRRIKKGDADLDRFAVELEDLFRRLFNDYARIVIHRVTPGQGKAGVVKVDPFSKDSHDETVIVKYGGHREIDREYTNYDDFVKGKIGARATSVLNLRRTLRLGGIVYSLIGVRLKDVVDFSTFYRQRTLDEIQAVLDDFFKETCANWHSDRDRIQHVRLTEEYEAMLGFGPEKLAESLKVSFGNDLDQKTLAFPDLPGVHFPNPVHAAYERPLARRTYLCTTHGDLNGHNLLIDADGHTWVIDFYRTGKGHILRDCIELETVVKFALLDEGGLPERFGLEQALAAMNRFKDADSLGYDAPDGACAKAFQVCRKLRQIARDLVLPNDDFSEYEIGLLYYTLNIQGFHFLPEANRRHALLSAGMLCEKLGLATA
ncbi:MAG: response regulator [Chloroflexota bacterium]